MKREADFVQIEFKSLLSASPSKIRGGARNFSTVPPFNIIKDFPELFFLSEQEKTQKALFDIIKRNNGY
jgi:hypothetical protein